ncbi:Hypothetical_protein [Hexamita inflata]|uniref:Hypothetical_protein n=1 Tax=Hexamita inflata TaxID=28002 RepID=A0AA86Q2V3_9EUKA|nr:Hypothetical protein HINF_LOCUS38810 [Hexamita inflata]
MLTIQQQKSFADQMIYEFKAQKDVLLFAFAFIPVVFCYSFAYLQTRTITFSGVKILTRIVIIAQISLFLVQMIVWKSCTETIIVRTFGQVGFLTSYLWSRLLQASTDAFLDSSLKITLHYHLLNQNSQVHNDAESNCSGKSIIKQQPVILSKIQMIIESQPLINLILVRSLMQYFLLSLSGL